MFVTGMYIELVDIIVIFSGEYFAFHFCRLYEKIPMKSRPYVYTVKTLSIGTDLSKKCRPRSDAAERGV